MSGGSVLFGIREVVVLSANPSVDSSEPELVSNVEDQCQQQHQGQNGHQQHAQYQEEPGANHQLPPLLTLFCMRWHDNLLAFSAVPICGQPPKGGRFWQCKFSPIFAFFRQSSPQGNPYFAILPRKMPRCWGATRMFIPCQINHYISCF